MQVLTDLQKMAGNENTLGIGKRSLGTVAVCTNESPLVADGADGTGQDALHRTDSAAESQFGDEFIAIERCSRDLRRRGKYAHCN